MLNLDPINKMIEIDLERNIQSNNCEHNNSGFFDKEELKTDEEVELGPHQWNTYAISCYENCYNCCGCLCLCPCHMGSIFHYIFNLPWPLAYLASVAALPVHPLLALWARVRVRKLHNLEGNLLSDVCCLLSCCWPLVMCQITDQIHALRRNHKWQLWYPARETLKDYFKVSMEKKAHPDNAGGDGTKTPNNDEIVDAKKPAVKKLDAKKPDNDDDDDEEEEEENDSDDDDEASSDEGEEDKSKKKV